MRLILAAIGLLLALLLIILFFRGPRIEKEDVDEGFAPRPDVVEWIEKHYGHERRKRAALMRLAEGDQYILTHPDAGIEASQKDAVAMECYSIAFGDDKDRIDRMPAYEAVAAQAYNTFARARKRNAYHGRLSSKVFGLGKVESWEEQCEKPLWR